MAIDGPAGVGKSTVARLVAARYGLTYVDSGAMYRCVALRARQLGLSPEDEAAVSRCAKQITICFRTGSEGQQVWLDGHEVTRDIRENEISTLASVVSRYPAVRAALTAMQREIATDQSVVMEGRDIGTVVFPDARVKVFLVASVEERARRRVRQLEETSRGQSVDAGAIRREIEERDRRDQERTHSPLVPAPDAACVDTDSLTISEVVDRIGALLPGGSRETTA